MAQNISILLGLGLFLEGCVIGHLKEPKYANITSNVDSELRTYQSRIVAETKVSGYFSNAPKTGFQRLADYSFGNNTTNYKIAMTAPESKNQKVKR